MANSLVDFSKVESNSYKQALMRYLQKFDYKEVQLKELAKLEDSVKNKIYQTLSKFTPDTLENEIETYSNKLYSDNELKIYYALSKKHNFDITENIVEWIDKLYQLISK